MGNDWSPYAKPQPDTGQFWCRLNEYTRGGVPKVKLHYVPVPCQHCANAPCLKACPVEGAIYKREDGAWSSSTRRSARAAASACSPAPTTPSSSTRTSTSRRSAPVAHTFSDEGCGPCPRSVDICPTQAIKFGDD